MQDTVIDPGDSTQAGELGKRRIRRLRARALWLVPGSVAAFVAGIVLLPVHLTGRAAGLPYGLILVGVLLAATAPYQLLLLSRARAALERQPVAMSATRRVVGRGRNRRNYIIVSGRGRDGGARESGSDGWGPQFDVARPVLVYYGAGFEPVVVVVDTKGAAVTVGKLRGLDALAPR